MGARAGQDRQCCQWDAARCGGKGVCLQMFASPTTYHLHCAGRLAYSHVLD